MVGEATSAKLNGLALIVHVKMSQYNTVSRQTNLFIILDHARR